MGSSQTRCRLGSPIMLLSHVLPLRPEPKIQTMFSGLTPLAGPPSNLLRSEAASRGTSLYLPASQRRPLRSTPGRPAFALLILVNATLPAAVLLVAEPDQELPGFFFVDLPVALVEQVFPVTRNAFPIERRRGPPGPARAPWRASRSSPSSRSAPPASRPCRPPGSRATSRPPRWDVPAGLRSAPPRSVTEQGGSVLDGLAHPESPVLGGFPQRLLGEHSLATLREFLGLLR